MIIKFSNMLKKHLFHYQKILVISHIL